jgi:hypothetical protein
MRSLNVVGKKKVFDLFFLAAQQSDSKILAFLLQTEAIKYINEPGIWGTALASAIGYCRFSNVKLLCEKGADISLKINWGVEMDVFEFAKRVGWEET